MLAVWRTTCRGGYRVGTKASKYFGGVDAVKRLRAVLEAMVTRYNVALARSLDGVNAFNTMPWARIVEALEFFKVPYYFARLTGSTLMTSGSGITVKEAYDKALRCSLLPGTAMVCYAMTLWSWPEGADDTKHYVSEK